MFYSLVNVLATSKVRWTGLRHWPENVSWYKVCAPDNFSTAVLIQKLIAFVDANPKYTLASTAVQMMIAQEYGCKK